MKTMANAYEQLLPQDISSFNTPKRSRENAQVNKSRKKSNASPSHFETNQGLRYETVKASTKSECEERTTKSKKWISLFVLLCFPRDGVTFGQNQMRARVETAQHRFLEPCDGMKTLGVQLHVSERLTTDQAKQSTFTPG